MGNGPMISAPAPWALVGQGYITLVKVDAAFARDRSFVSDTLKDSFRGGIGSVMYVDYLSSDVGPYRELLFIPGRFGVGGKKRYSISRIFVSTEESVMNGRRNWGIPKERADFDTDRYGAYERVYVSREGRQFAELHFRSMPFTVPVNATLVPGGQRTLAHHHEGRTYLTTPWARGAVSPARLTYASIDGSVFPDFTRGFILGTVKIPHFLMTFPEARVL